jgi:predicted DNA-binding transcriptional regulator YafY
MSAVAVDSGIHELLYGAIENKRLLRFRYQDKERIIEPHDYGIQKGIHRLLSWQIGGQSNGRLPGWRWFDVSEMQDVEVLDKSFPGNREVSGKHHRWDQVFIRVAPPSDLKKE